MERTCKYCGNDLPMDKHRNTFCNRSCSAKYNNPLTKTKYKKKKCPVCDKEMVGYTTNTFCSHKCEHQYKYEEYINRWLQGQESGSRGMGISAYIRRWLFEQNNNKCEQCGWGEINPVSGSVFLEVEHIDGNWQNNKPENLKLLCPNCHSLTPTYMNLNKGNGRPDRRIPKHNK